MTVEVTTEVPGTPQELTRVVVLISGGGSNLQALIDQQHNINTEIVAVVSNRPQAYGLERAKAAGIPAVVVDHTEFSEREAFDQKLQTAIDSYSPDLLVMAGFMRIVSEDFTRHYSGRMLNIHPSLLPKHKGLHTHRRVLEQGDSEHGTTVHFVTADLDGGPTIIQARMPVRPGDSEEKLCRRVQQLEHIIYPVAVGWFALGRLRLERGMTILDGHELPPEGYQHTSLSLP